MHCLDWLRQLIFRKPDHDVVKRLRITNCTLESPSILHIAYLICTDKAAFERFSPTMVCLILHNKEYTLTFNMYIHNKPQNRETNKKGHNELRNTTIENSLLHANAIPSPLYGFIEGKLSDRFTWSISSNRKKCNVLRSWKKHRKKLDI